MNGKDHCCYKWHHHRVLPKPHCGRDESVGRSIVAGGKKPDWKEPVVRSCRPCSSTLSVQTLPSGLCSQDRQKRAGLELACGICKWEANPRMLKGPHHHGYCSRARGLSVWALELAEDLGCGPSTLLTNCELFLEM